MHIFKNRSNSLAKIYKDDLFFEIYGFLYSAIMELKYYSILENRIVNLE